LFRSSVNLLGPKKNDLIEQWSNKEMKIFIFIMNDIKAKDSQAFQEALIAEAFK